MNTIKYIAVAATFFLALSCSKWTEQEPISVTYVTLQEKNPQLYEAYLKSVLNYKSTDHKVMIVKYDNVKTLPEGRADHLTCLPDSVDYVILMNPAVAGTYYAGEMEEIRTVKGTKTLMQVDVDALVAEYDAIIDAENARAAEDETYEAPGNSLERFTEWMGKTADEQFELIDRNGFDGVDVVYVGKNHTSMTEEAKAAFKERQEAFFSRLMAWADADKNRLLFFEGKPKNLLVDEDVLGRSRYILIQTTSAVNVYELTSTLKDVTDERTPSDRYVVTTSVIALDDESNHNGEFDDGGTAILGAAWWTNAGDPSFVKAGIAVEHAQNDYYNSGKVYPNITGAIAIMNPSPLK